MIDVSGVNGGDGSVFLVVRYGDECFYDKLSLLHFIVFFLLGGLTVLVVGAVQFKDEAGLSNLKYHFLVAGSVLIAIGVLLLVVKCACFRIPLPNEDEEMMEDFGAKPSEEKELSNKDLNSPYGSMATKPPHLSVTITPASLTSAASSRSRTPPMKEDEPGTPEEKYALTQKSPTSTPRSTRTTSSNDRDRRSSHESIQCLKSQSVPSPPKKRESQ